jgi:uncharacterized protein with HEPN domain
MSDERRYLHDILANLERVVAFTAEGYEAFSADDKTQYAVIRAYEIIGEAAKRLSSELLAQQPTVNWQRIKGFRDFLIHNYDKVDLQYLWVAVEDIPHLKAAVHDLLDSLDAPQTDTAEET